MALITDPGSPLSSDAPSLAPPAGSTESIEQWMTELQSLLRKLETVAAANPKLPPVFSDAIDNQLAQARLGTAASLFAALQCKNAATAGHALRVALTCSAWAAQMGLASEQRDVVEIAALLHDIGAIGVPNRILQKPGLLDPEEAAIMAKSRTMSVEILRRSCRSTPILEIVENVSAWFDGSHGNFAVRGTQIPLGARMIAIAEAFDAMITDHVYRPARSQERAMAELFDCGGAQFDPALLRQFVDFHEHNTPALRWQVAQRWLRSLDSDLVDSYWELNCVPSPQSKTPVDALFQAKLLDNMYDAVVFVDATGHITLWNRGAERLTGIAASTVRDELWQPELLGMSDENRRPIAEEDCPVYTAIRCGVQSLRRLTVSGRGDRVVAVDTHAIPVMNEDGIVQGAILLFHDASSETSLEKQCQTLHDKSTKDPMTQVANRAEFDRVHAIFVTAHQQQQAPCSLLICDLDHFKQVNDTYGHQAGDDVIKSLASLLKNSCRPGDLVARYGGEEFVMLCADCGNAAAARRAEQVRLRFSRICQPRMDGQSATVSFGVTEAQAGDTPDTMLRRADRALLMSKAMGRNCVTQLGSGLSEKSAKESPSAFASGQSPTVLQQELVTRVPVKIAVEKLRGFIADHQATVSAVNANEVDLEIDDRQLGLLRRLTDRPVAFNIHLRFDEERWEIEPSDNGQNNQRTQRTRIQITIAPRKSRDRRRNDTMERAKQVLTSFRSYLMADDLDSQPTPKTLTRIKRALAPWLMK